MPPLEGLFVGFVLSFVIAVGAVRARLLTSDGAAAAVAVGTIVFGFGGWGHAALLFVFFLSSSLLTRWQHERKHHPEHRRGRTADQVLANGLVAALLAVWWNLQSSTALAAAFLGAVAASTADTWATEVGLLSPIPPRMITTWRQVPPGVSGGVTAYGTLAGIAGAGLIAAGAGWLDVPVWIPWLSGSISMLFDSVLGATVEGKMRGMTNDAVNLLVTLLGAALAAGLVVLSR